MSYVKEIYELMNRDDFKNAGTAERVQKIKDEIYEKHFYKSTDEEWDLPWIWSKKQVWELVQCEVRVSRILYTHTSHGNVHYANIGAVEHNEKFIELLQMILATWGKPLSLNGAFLLNDIEYKSIENSILRFLTTKPEYIEQMRQREQKTIVFADLRGYDHVHNGRHDLEDNSLENKTVTEVHEVIVY